MSHAEVFSGSGTMLRWLCTWGIPVVVSALGMRRSLTAAILSDSVESTVEQLYRTVGYRIQIEGLCDFNGNQNREPQNPALRNGDKMQADKDRCLLRLLPKLEVRAYSHSKACSVFLFTCLGGGPRARVLRNNQTSTQRLKRKRH